MNNDSKHSKCIYLNINQKQLNLTNGMSAPNIRQSVMWRRVILLSLKIMFSPNNPYTLYSIYQKQAKKIPRIIKMQITRVLINYSFLPQRSLLCIGCCGAHIIHTNEHTHRFTVAIISHQHCNAIVRTGKK